MLLQNLAELVLPENTINRRNRPPYFAPTPFETTLPPSSEQVPVGEGSSRYKILEPGSNRTVLVKVRCNPPVARCQWAKGVRDTFDCQRKTTNTEENQQNKEHPRLEPNDHSWHGGTEIFCNCKQAFWQPCRQAAPDALQQKTTKQYEQDQTA
eukprot:NODE_938_length_1545_cov_50.485190_g927_i0.p2 GENE.NODE_938_length_1545_cov_50.485190_g927_i0~~NODE_938_length_1545_cov_50.485190_g927_i0.p2  ORF type:complete len:153 (+),score=17.21 NODE_938_length_1545_cov_50.485190_g927_i0:247-705(+)